MHADVGAARADRGNRVAADSLDGGLHVILYRAAVRLGLPAAKTAAVVLKAESDSHKK